MEKNYDHTQEKALAKAWETARPKAGYFNPDNLPGTRKKKFVISMPPPNATGVLHLGHAARLTIEDIMVRYHRMAGDDTAWIPGTDHAAIATNAKVEQLLKQEGKTKDDLGREKFLKRVREYVKDSKGTIRAQIRAVGASCDWSREQFTLSPELSSAVTRAFVDMYDAGLIYRGQRVVHWCPHCASTLADDEVEYREEPTTLYTFRYDKCFPFAISTTRPETKLGDTAVAVYPSDKRYKKYIGKMYTVHIGGVERKIRIVADRGVDMQYGTGALGVTPAHSQTDETIAQREKLPSIKIIGEDGRMTPEAGAYAGLRVREAREKLVQELKDNGLIKKEEPIQHNLSVCYRCDTPIEPLPSKQWFVAVDKPYTKGRKKYASLKQQAITWVKNEKIAILPKRFEKVYYHWMEDLHDWNISRQIWYGHEIPVWYRTKNAKGGSKKESTLFVGKEKPKGRGWKKDPDVLDTWFSSALWTFSTLGWPQPEAGDLKRFHPTTVMETAYDILFFWVARMILMTSFCLDDKPFETVYLSGLIRDRQNRKMSKSLNNGVDPMVMIERYGADALRLAVSVGIAPGQDQQFYEEKIKGYRNFVNKLWNIARFSLPAITENPSAPLKLQTMPERAVFSKLQGVIQETTDAIQTFQFGRAGELLYEFVWHTYADWYLEIVKQQPNSALLREALVTILKLLHPYTPFVTEAIWQELPKEIQEIDQLIVAPWPNAGKRDAAAEQQFDQLVSTVTMLRRYRQYASLPENVPLSFLVSSGNTESQEADLIKHFVQLEWRTGKASKQKRALLPTDISGTFGTDIDVGRLQKELAGLEAQLKRIDAQLNNKVFVTKAPERIVAELKEKRASYQARREELRSLMH